jgi:hypothetical protein
MKVFVCIELINLYCCKELNHKEAEKSLVAFPSTVKLLDRSIQY